MEPFFVGARVEVEDGGLGKGKAPWGYWYGQGSYLEVPGLGRVKLDRALVRPSLSPVNPAELGGRKGADKEQARFFKALRSFQQGDYLASLVYLQTCKELPEVWALMGFIMLLQDKPKGAVSFFETYLAEGEERRVLDFMGVVPYLSCDIGPGVVMGATVSHRGIRALLARIYRHLGALDSARSVLERLVFSGKDPLVILELVELYYHQGEYNKVVDLIHDMKNETPFHTLALFYMALALEEMGVLPLALMAYNTAIRRRKDRDPDLIKFIRYRRALLYQKMRRLRRYRQEITRLWEEDPGYEDVDLRMAGIL